MLLDLCEHNRYESMVVQVLNVIQELSLIHILLTLDELNKNANYDGIQQRNVLEWLLESC